MNRSTRATNVLIIGGGVIGCSIAYHLAKEGIDVEVVDQGEIGAQASSAAAGLLAPLLPCSSSSEFMTLLLASFALFPSLVSELEDASDIPIHYTLTGTLRTASNARGFKRLQQSCDCWNSWGFQTSLLDGAQARALEPELASSMYGAVHAPEEAQLQAPALVSAFARAASHRGVLLSRYTEVVGIERTGGKVTRVLTARGDVISCNHLVVASGAWSARIGDWLSLEVPVRPVRGQVITLRQPAAPVRHIIFGEGIYLAPKSDGTVLVGATKEDVGFHAETTPEGVGWLRTQATRLVPGLGESALVAAWAGLRPKTSDGQPILGAVPWLDNVTIATGHNAFGVTLSAITGLLIAQQVMTLSTGAPEIMRAFSPLRFREATSEAFATSVA